MRTNDQTGQERAGTIMIILRIIILEYQWVLNHCFRVKHVSLCVNSSSANFSVSSWFDIKDCPREVSAYEQSCIKMIG